MIDKSLQAPRYFAAIDLGSNSFHMLVVQIEAGQTKEVMRYKQRVRLAAGLDADNRLSEEAIARGVSVLETFTAKLSRYSPLDVKTVATHTLRVATNRQEFLDKALALFNYPIQVITGEQEAELVYRGVQASEQAKGKTLVIDIGGGSTEIAIGDQQQLLAAHSCRMGCITYTQAFFNQGMTKSAFANADQRARLELAPIADQLKQVGWDQVKVTSGTGDVLFNLALRSSASKGIGADTLAQAKAALLSNTQSLADPLFEGVSEHRKVLLPAGISILNAVMDALGVEHATYSPGALRDGLLAMRKQ